MVVDVGWSELRRNVFATDGVLRRLKHGRVFSRIINHRGGRFQTVSPFQQDDDGVGFDGLGGEVAWPMCSANENGDRVLMNFVTNKIQSC